MYDPSIHEVRSKRRYFGDQLKVDVSMQGKGKTAIMQGLIEKCMVAELREDAQNRAVHMRLLRANGGIISHTLKRVHNEAD